MKEALENLLQSRMVDQDPKQTHWFCPSLSWQRSRIAGLFASQIAYGRVTYFHLKLKNFDIVIFLVVLEHNST